MSQLTWHRSPITSLVLLPPLLQAVVRPFYAPISQSAKSQDIPCLTQSSDILVWFVE